MTSMISPLRRAEIVAADAVATICEDVQLTYGETAERCRRLTWALRNLGLEPGDRAAVVAPNSHRYLELYQAVPGAGLVLVPLNARDGAAELRYALEDSGARVLFAGVPVDRSVEALMERVIDLRDGYEALLDAAQPAAFPTLGQDGLAGLFYTGGTTGVAKGVMLTHGNLLANALHLQACWSFGRETRWLVAAPMFHAAGTIAALATVWNAGCQIILPTFDAAAALDLIERHAVTHTLLVPTMLAALADEQAARPRDVSTLRGIAHGGAPVSTATLRAAHAAFPSAELLHIYGATETSPIATLLPHEERLLDAPQSRSCGQPAVGVEVEVHDIDGQRLASGAVGEVVIRGSNVMAGYWRKSEATKAALHDGWYRSGDLGYQDEHGYLYLVDRAKDMIVTGGENVYCTEVENVLASHPAVREVAVFGIPDERWGEAVHAIVVARAEVTVAELHAHCRTRIAGYKTPKAIELRTEPLPKSGAGKLLKRRLREPYWQDRGALVGGA